MTRQFKPHTDNGFMNLALPARKTMRHWLVLLVATLLITGILGSFQLPAIYLIGPMVAGLIMASRGATLKLPPLLVAFSQGIIGLFVARGMPISVLAETAKDGGLFIVLVFSVIALSFGIGWILANYQILPGTTAIWGSAPGGASAMIVMAEAAGADFQLVAFMLYLRMLMVAGTASLIARIVLGSSGNVAAPEPWLAPFAPTQLLLTLAIAATGPIASRLFKRPSINLLLPLVIGIVLHSSGIVEITLPMWLLAGAYVIFAWNVGFRFTRTIVTHALKALPILLLTTLTLIVLCGGLALAVAHFYHIGLLTAYLATSPGGVDSIAIIAASAPVDKPFVLAMQVARLLSVLIFGPIFARFFARQFERRAAKRNAAE